MSFVEWFPRLVQASLTTLYMVGVSTFLTVLLGLPLGVLLVVSDAHGLDPKPVLNKVLGMVVNLTRSLPFIILLVVLIPLTRWIVGTSIGPTAAIVPLTLAAVPFFARVTESALREVPSGLVEAAQAMGSSEWQIVSRVYIPEALPGLALGIALTLISLVGYSAMAGAVGGGGLGDLAIRYGYQRFETEVMIVTVVLLVVFVQSVQTAGDRIAKKVSKR